MSFDCLPSVRFHRRCQTRTNKDTEDAAELFPSGKENWAFEGPRADCVTGTFYYKRRRCVYHVTGIELH